MSTRTRALALMLFVLRASAAHASDHLDTPTVIADPAADIADLFAWTASDGRHLNLVMTVVGHRFSDRIQYVFHVDSGSQFGRTTSSTTILCQFGIAQDVECWAGDVDHARGAASPSGLVSDRGRFRVFAGLRDDPFFNNVKGTRAALNAASAALQRGVPRDAAGCPAFNPATSKELFHLWSHTDGGPGANFLAGWKVGALVVAIDLSAVSQGGPMLAVWGGTYRSGAQHPSGLAPKLGAPVDRIGRPLVGNALIAPLGPEEASDQRKEAYNRADSTTWAQFATDFEPSLALYDGLDGVCGNQWLAGATAGPSRYRRLAELLADDRLWVKSDSTSCTQFLAVERAAFGGPSSLKRDCGGRTPSQDVVDVLRSLWAMGAPAGLEDGVSQDDRVASPTAFPFLAAP